MNKKLILLSILIGLMTCMEYVRAETGKQVLLVLDPNPGKPALHGLEKLEDALQSINLTVTRSRDVLAGQADFLILAGRTDTEGPAVKYLKALNVDIPDGTEALVVRQTEIQGKPALVLCGSDDVGLMYAALDVSQRISWTDTGTDPFKHIQDAREQPFVLERAVSAYTMQRAHFERFLYDETYLERYFDILASSRINSFVLIFGYENGGFMAPAFPYFFNVDGFPDVEMVGITPGQQARNKGALKRMIQIAHNRGISFCPGFWDHIYRGKVQGGGIPGASEKAGVRTNHLVSGVTTGNLLAYNQAAIKKFIQEFPEIDAIQFRMHGESGLTRSEIPVFWHNVFATIKKLRPGLRLDLRAKQLPDQVIEDAIDQGLDFRITTKYWMEQMGLPYHPTHINKQNQNDRRHGYADLLRYPQRYNIHWRLWNGGTTRILLWADPEYVRRFAESTRVYKGNSFEINDMLATKMLGKDHGTRPFELLNRQYRYYDYEFERYWHYYQVWGRVGYNPGVSSEIWKQECYRRFGRDAGSALMEGLHLASRVLPRIVATSYPYAHFPTTRGWAEMQRQGDLPDYASAEGSDIQQFMNMADYAAMLLDGTTTAMRTPVQTSRWFGSVSGRILEKVNIAEQAGDAIHSKEFISTVTDLKILASLAEYHSRRLLAGVQYNLYVLTGDLFAFDKAIELEKEARDAWSHIVEAAGDVYSRDMAFGVQRVGFSRHWSDELKKLERGIKEMMEERQNALPEPEESGPRIAHVPVRRLKTPEAMAVQATIVSQTAITAAFFLVENEDRLDTIHMKPAGNGMFEARIPPQEWDTSFGYVIEARDFMGMKAVFPGSGLPDPIRVVPEIDKNVPAVALERIQKATPGRNLTIHAKVSDPSGLKQVRLRYRHMTQFEDYQAADMHFNQATGLYQASIPGSFIIPDWDLMYFIEATDSAGNGCMIPDLEKEMPYVIVEMVKSEDIL